MVIQVQWWMHTVNHHLESPRPAEKEQDAAAPFSAQADPASSPLEAASDSCRRGWV